MSATRKTIRMVVTGRVQGVGFRAYLAHAAARLELDGWTRNSGENRVETLVSGGAVALEDFVQIARRGPPGARVDSCVEEEVAEAQLEGRGFRVAPSV
jgi:acylphosphatase